MPTNVVTVTTTSSDPLGIDLSWTTLYDALANSALQPGATGTQFTLVEDSEAPSLNFRLVLTGTGLTYSGNELTGGTISGLEILDQTNDLLASYSNFNIAAAALSSAINTYASSNDTDASALNAIFLATSGQQYSYDETGNAADTLQGGAVSDTLDAGGTSALIGGSGAETFDYATGDGEVTISNFAPGQGDVIDLTAAGIADFAEIQSHASVASGSTIINFGSNQVIDLIGFTSPLTASDFNIVPLTINPIAPAAVIKDSTVSSVTTSLTTNDTDPDATVSWSLVGGSTPHAPDYSVAIDEFKITSGGSTEFDDTFASSTPPDYNGTTTPASYAVTAGATVVNSGHQDLLEGSNSAAISAGSDAFLGQFVTLKTGTSGPEALLSGTAFTVSAVFSLSIPEARNAYGIELSDKSGTSGNDDDIRLQVTRRAGGAVQVTLDQVNGSISSNRILQGITLNPAPGDNQIELQLTNDPSNNGNIIASFELLANGVVDTTQTFTLTGSIFDSTNWTQAQFFADAPEESDSVLQGTYGTFDLTQAGSLTYALNNSQANVATLTQGETVTDSATVKATDSDGNSATTPAVVTVDGASPLVSVTINGSGAPVASSFDQFLGFGDSNTDSGYYFNTPISSDTAKEAQYQAAVSAGGGLPTSVGGVMNSTLLAEDYGLNADPYNPGTGSSGSPLGTNYAASGATVTGSLSGSLAPSITSQIQTYLSSTGGVANPDAIYLISGGANDAAIAEGLPGQQGDAFMVSEANSLANALITLHNDGAQYIVIDNDTGASTYGAIFNATLDSDLGAAGVPFIDSDARSLFKAIEADPSAYGISNVDPGVVAGSVPYDPFAGGADLNPNSSEFPQGWALYATQLVSANAGSTYLWADDGHLSAAGQAIEANYDHELIQTDTPVVGETLSADPAVVNGAGSDFSYQWQSLAAGSSIWNDISGATNSNYVVQDSDIGAELRVAISFTDADTGQVANAFSAPTFDVVPCYCLGTLIATDRGEVAVETLAIGDRVLTRTGALRPIKWIGRRSYAGRFTLGRKDILPICIKAGALDENVPRRDLWISPHHAMYFENGSGALIEAKDLINGVSIVQARSVEKIEYFHIELDSHDVILAEDALSETFIDEDSRGMFHNVHENVGEPAELPARYYAPRLDEGYQVDAARRRIALRAGLLGDADTPHLGALHGFIDAVGPSCIAGWAQNTESPETPVCLDVIVDGCCIGQMLANHYREDLAQAGLGSGRHGFLFTPPPRRLAAAQSVEVRRSLDGAALLRSADIQAYAPPSAA
jgi:VCBS repeat-containing protein